MIRAFLATIQFMTILPVLVKWTGQLTEKQQGQMVLFYPVAGFIIGAMLFATSYWLPPQGLLSAAIITVLWIALTGALHLDGLADSADAWLGGLGSKQRTLEIMKDPRAGSMAIVAVCCVILLKFTAIHELLVSHQSVYLILIPVLARMNVMLLFITTAYARADGIGAVAASNTSKIGVAVMLMLITLFSYYYLQVAALYAIAASVLVLLLVRHLMLRRLQGTTGDTAGALIEISEVVTVVIILSLK